MNTHVFKLPSGVECEVKGMVGKHQRILTEKQNSDSNDNLNKVLADVIVRVGSNKDINEQFVKSMLSCDRKKALVEVRQFTMDFETSFEFNYDYKDSNGQKQNYPLTLDLTDGFPVKPLIIVEGDKVKEADYTEYSDIQRDIELVLPKSGMKIVFSLLDGKGEDIGSRTAKGNRSSHTAIKMRNPRELKESKNSGEIIPIQLNLDNLPFKDIEYLRATIKEIEGRVDTEFMFEHPEADFQPLGQRDVVIDIISQKAFFFPSEAI